MKKIYSFLIILFICAFITGFFGCSIDDDSSDPTSLIIFISTIDGNSEVYSMNSDGSELTNLSNNSASENEPVWSANGTKIAFRSHRDGDE